MTTPVRIQRSRAKGSRLVSPNGLPVVCVSRPGRWGNPFILTTRRHCSQGWEVADTRVIVDMDWGGEPMIIGVFDSREEASRCAVECFRTGLLSGALSISVEDVRRELRNKNLACWCPLEAECHGDILLEIASGGAR